MGSDMTERDALRSLLIYAHKEAQSQQETVVAKWLTLAIADLATTSRNNAQMDNEREQSDVDMSYTMHTGVRFQ